MDLASRKRIEIERKLAALENELTQWRKLSEANGPLEKHHTQIGRLATILGGLQAQIRKKLPPPPPRPSAAPTPDLALADCRALERMILEVHRIWEFFRSKLVLRDAALFRDYLLVADELAWACYEPALKRATSNPSREPPLVFFNGGSSPFAMSRRSAFDAEAVPGEVFCTPEFKRALSALPIPVIGIPWFQAEFLPELVVVAHEVGHAVEDDLGLTTTLRKALDAAMASRGVPAARQPAWRAWLGEMFADLWGTLAVGPAFTGALIDFLARDPGVVTREQRAAPSWGAYPTDALRVLFSATVLETIDKTDFAAEAASLRASWTKVYASHAMRSYEDDLPVVAEALLAGPYPELGGVRLDAVLSFSRAQHKDAGTAAEQALRKQPIGARDARALVAAARLAFEREPSGYTSGDAQQRLIQAVKTGQSAGVRGKPKWRTDEEKKRVEVVDQKTAGDLYTRLAGTEGGATSQESP
jgi:hypothetical protein